MNRRDFARTLLAELELPDTEQNVLALVAWQAAENTGAENNPLATTMQARGATGHYNAAGVQNFDSADHGLAATLATLRLELYGPIIGALRQGGSAEVTCQAIANSPWGTGPLILRVLPNVRDNLDHYAGLDAGGQGGPPPTTAHPGAGAPLAPAEIPVGPAPAGRDTLREGARGAEVAALQWDLARAGFDTRSRRANGSFDGIFGPGTAEAVRELQARDDLQVDGIVGAQTWAALGVR